jgi:hypothetical protein
MAPCAGRRRPPRHIDALFDQPQRRAALTQLQKRTHDDVDSHWRKRGRRRVEQHDPGIARQHPPDRGHLLLASAQKRRLPPPLFEQLGAEVGDRRQQGLESARAPPRGRRVSARRSLRSDVLTFVHRSTPQIS